MRQERQEELQLQQLGPREYRRLKCRLVTGRQDEHGGGGAAHPDPREDGVSRSVRVDCRPDFPRTGGAAKLGEYPAHCRPNHFRQLTLVFTLSMVEKEHLILSFFINFIIRM